MGGHDLPHVVEENDLRFKDRMTDVYYKDSLADRAVARFNRTRLVRLNLHDDVVMSWELFNPCENPVKDAELENSIRKVQKNALFKIQKLHISRLVMLLNNHGRITRPMVFKRVEAYPRHIVATIQRVQSLSGLPDRNRARELHAAEHLIARWYSSGPKGMMKIGGHEGKNIFSWYLREVGTDLCTVQEIGAQCALEEREVVEHRTVDADYEYEIEPAMQYELKIVGFHHFDTMIVILSSPLCFRVLEDISDNILAIKTTNGILPSRKSDPEWLVKQRKDEVKTMRRCKRWNVCTPYGRLVDAFIANKRSKAGKRFGFMRYLGVTDVTDIA
ncbi:hypothetical protein Tco_0026605, partial [Tanacetum coccineum]